MLKEKAAVTVVTTGANLTTAVQAELEKSGGQFASVTDPVHQGQNSYVEPATGKLAPAPAGREVVMPATDELLKVIRKTVHFVTIPGLALSPMATMVMGNTTIVI